ncbi:unnamed protein product [Aureobasidium mustum]|uniref:Uncharacterized protein n=1 Tax=Aureobasidium mustum TaxID=2773714 RepID=A0A9N8JI47_9PEZI|nr:unnamed protein product [Aureobasidium mustum]
MPRIVWQCFAPVSDPGNHGSDPSKWSLQVAPFQSENNSIWIGHHNQPSRKYLGVFPSFDEVIDRCRRNAIAGGPNTSFPRFTTRVFSTKHTDVASPESYSRHVCCAACQDSGMERMTLQFLPVKTGLSTGRTKNKTVYLIMYKFWLRGEQMVALLQHVASGKHCFQKTDGTLSKVLALDSKHGCRDHSQSLSPSESEDDSDSSSLTEFDCAEDETATDANISPHPSLPSNQWHQLQEPMTNIVAPSPQTPPMPQELPAQPRVRGRVVIDMTDDDEPSPIKQETSDHSQHMTAPMLYGTPSATPASTPSIAPSEDLSFSDRFGPDPLAEEFGRITTQIVQEYSMRVFALPEVIGLIQRMKQAVKAGDRPALCRAYGALQAFLITVE